MSGTGAILDEAVRRIFASATPVQARELHMDRNYGAPYSFWQTAVMFGLATKEEMEVARRFYGNLWHYRGD